MAVATVTSVNVKQAVPFFGVTNMESSLRFYVDGLGFKMKNCWIPDRAEDHPDGEFAGAGFSLATPRSCFRSSGRRIGQRKRLGQVLRSPSCAKTRSPFIASSNRAEFRRGAAPLWETVCGLCRLPIPTLSHGVASPTDAPEESELEE